MTRISFKASALVLLGLLTFAPFAVAGKHKVILYQSYASPTWYEVATTPQSAPPVYTYTVPVYGAAEAPAEPAQIYVYRATTPVADMGRLKIKAPRDSTAIFVDGQFVGLAKNVEKVAVEPGSHDVRLQDASGNVVYNGAVTVASDQTTEIKPR